MPELPDLERVREVLEQRLSGVIVVSAEVRRPVVVRDLIGAGPSALSERTIVAVARRGKFLVLTLSAPPRLVEAASPAGPVYLVIHPMLAGRLRYGPPLSRHRVRDALILILENGDELRYHDARDMGKVYITAHVDEVPGYSELGPDATASDLTLDLFRERLRRRSGEIKRVLTDQGFVAGIGNAYADEICWRAEIYPFRRRASLDAAEVMRLYEAMRAVLLEAIEVLRARVGDDIDVEIRDFLAVHGRAGEPCPRCGSPISEVTREKRSTHFCRTCQPGLLVGRRDSTFLP